MQIAGFDTVFDDLTYDELIDLQVEITKVIKWYEENCQEDDERTVYEIMNSTRNFNPIK
jgi:hypothetical protein